MSFSNSSINIHLEGPVLIADCLMPDGQYQNSELLLDNVLGNNNGQFQWGGTSFSETAQNINLQDNVIFSANLTDENGNPQFSQVNLDDHIQNNDGVLQAVNI